MCTDVHTTDKTEKKREQEKKRERKKKEYKICLHTHSRLHICKLTEQLTERC